jgi:PhzF family phenazine biosynthesis protein
MADTLAFQLVDAFTLARCSGNRAGVVFDADALSENQMQRIADEIGASETAFLSRLNDIHRPVRLRWFTPTQEVDFCGHATLAATHALVERGALTLPADQPAKPIEFETRAGPLQLHPEKSPTTEATAWWLGMPAGVPERDTSRHSKLWPILGLQEGELNPSIPPVRTRDDDIIVLAPSLPRLLELQPDFSALTAWSRQNRVRGVCLTTTHTFSATAAAQSRFFAPAAGVTEDPVTGSVHGPLAIFLAQHNLVTFENNRALLNCIQAIPGGRAGSLRVLVERDGETFSTAICGTCVTSMTGELRTPDASAAQ